MLLNAFASVLSSSQSSGMEDTTVYPFWLSLICFAIVPAIIEEYIFRGGDTRRLSESGDDGGGSE